MHHVLDGLFAVKKHKAFANVNNWLSPPTYHHSCRMPLGRNKERRKMACCNCMKLHEHPWMFDGYW